MAWIRMSVGIMWPQCFVKKDIFLIWYQAGRIFNLIDLFGKVQIGDQ